MTEKLVRFVMYTLRNYHQAQTTDTYCRNIGLPPKLKLIMREDDYYSKFSTAASERVETVASPLFVDLIRQLFLGVNEEKTSGNYESLSARLLLAPTLLLLKPFIRRLIGGLKPPK